jgi:hypothetical protein
MNIALNVNQSELLDVLLNVAVIRPVFIWGAPGIGKYTTGSESAFRAQGESIQNEVKIIAITIVDGGRLNGKENIIDTIQYSYFDNVTFKEYEGLTHLFMPATENDVVENMEDLSKLYSTPEHVDPQVLSDIADWILAQ